MALLQLSDDLIRNWSSLGVEEHSPVNETMLTFTLKLSIKSLFGSNEVTDENIKEIMTEYLIVSAFSVEFALIFFFRKTFICIRKNLSNTYLIDFEIGLHKFIVLKI